MLETESYFKLRARGDATGTFAVVEICATLDHGDAGDITAFMDTYADDPGVAGGICDWRADGIVVLTLTDPDETKQATMTGFLYMSLLSGRFTITPEIQARIFGAVVVP